MVVVLYHLFRLFTALYFLVYFSSIVERPEGITRELDDSAKRKTQWVGGRDQEKCRGCRNPLKSEFSVFPETENSHWFKGDKSVITLTTADHDCIQMPFVACNSCR